VNDMYLLPFNTFLLPLRTVDELLKVAVVATHGSAKAVNY